MKRYKLVDQQYRTRTGKNNETCWQLPDGSRPRIDARGTTNELCSDGVIHSYASPELAAFMNPGHANIKNARCIEIKCGPLVADDGSKGGHKWAQMTGECEFPQPSTRQRVIFAILAVRAIPGQTPIPGWERWADAVLDIGHTDNIWTVVDSKEAAGAAMWDAWESVAAPNTAAAAILAAQAAIWADQAGEAATYAAEAATRAAQAATIDFAALAQQAMAYPEIEP